MGYYTNFEIEIDRDGDAVITDLMTSASYTRFFSTGSNTWRSEDKWKWYDHEDELKAVSLRHPLSRITVVGYGESEGDIWCKYFVAGQMQKHELKITFPPCTLRPPDANCRIVNVSVLGHDVPVEVEYIGAKTDDELYNMAKEQLRRMI
jgi:hypothetical protein